MGDMLTPEEKHSILERVQKKRNTPGLIYGKEKDPKSSWENLRLKKKNYLMIFTKNKIRKYG